jgi:hypothetical protein
MDPLIVLYFGAWPGDTAGHYLRYPNGGPRALTSVPWSLAELDGRLCPTESGDERQPEGAWQLHHRDGWTCFAFWCRLFDTRFNSCSAFLVNRQRSIKELLTDAQVIVPTIWQALAAEGNRFPWTTVSFSCFGCAHRHPSLPRCNRSMNRLLSRGQWSGMSALPEWCPGFAPKETGK